MRPRLLRLMSDTLWIQGIEASCRLGVFEQEQAQPQPVWIDVAVPIDAARAAERDDVRDALDYAQLVASVKQAAEGRSYRLLETMAETIAARVLAHGGVRCVRVQVKKRALPGLDYAAVEIERRATRPRRPARVTARRSGAAARR